MAGLRSPLRQGLLWGVLLVLAACATPPPPPSEPRPASLRVITDPTSAIILIAGERMSSGQRIRVEPGVYDLVVELENYQRHSEQLVLSAGTNMDRVVNLRPLDAELTIRVEPPDAQIRIADRRPEAGRPIELRPGRYLVEASRDGYFPDQSRVRLKPGERQSLNFNLQRIPTADQLTLRAHHPDARLLLDGKEVGVGNATLQADFETYRFESILELSDWRRERSEQTIRFQRGGEQRFEAGPALLEYKYLGRWLPAEQALEEEQQVYEARKVLDPVHLHAAISPEVAASLHEYDQLGEWLFSFLRPGDRLTLSFGENEVLLWARGHEPDSAFAEGAAAFKNDLSKTPPWAPSGRDIGERKVNLSEVADLPFALLAARPHNPLLSLDGRALQARANESVDIQRIAGDGELRLIAQGGSALTLDNAELIKETFGLVDLVMPAQTSTHTLKWEHPPDRLLLIPVAGPSVASPPRVELKRGEKKLVVIDLPLRPERVQQLTLRVDSEGAGDWETLEWTIAPGQAPDLREVDIGPHSREGVYRRSWIFEYLEGGDLTQRQIDAEYYIGEEQAEVLSGLFLRRRPGGGNEGN